MYRLLRPLLFALPPESAHALALASLRALGAWRRPLQRAAAPIDVLGMRFPNRVGVAAGLDKDGIAVKGLARLGFGFVEVGTVTPKPQAGNPKPRLFRLPEDRAVVNRMGFNSAGVDAVVANLKRHQAAIDVPVGVNIGKNLAHAACRRRRRLPPLSSGPLRCGGLHHRQLIVPKHARLAHAASRFGGPLARRRACSTQRSAG